MKILTRMWKKLSGWMESLFLRLNQTKVHSADATSVNKPASDANREHKIIELVQQIYKNSSLSLYADLWFKAGFMVTKNYRTMDHTTTSLAFSSIPLHEQVSNFAVREDRSEEDAAYQLIDLIAPLLRTKQHSKFFDLWQNAGFHITAIPATKVAHPRFKPNLFLLGAAKAGTTTIHRYLSEIPSVCMSEPKEPFFFEAEYELGLDFYRQRYFQHWNGETIIGDARHRNLYLPYIAKRIFAVNPNAKLIICVRNPIERAYSHWWFWYSAEIESLSFEEAMQEDIERIQAGWLTQTPQEMDVYKQVLDWTGKGIYRSYLDSGYYYQQICRYLEYFPKKQIKVVLFEDLEQDPYPLIKELENFIDTNYYKQNTFSLKKENVHVPDGHNRKRTPISENFRTFLRNHYQEHNNNLAQFIGRDLSHWQ